MFKFFTEQQGPVSKSLCRPIQTSAAKEQKSMIQEMLEFQKLQWEMQTQQMMTESMKKMQKNQELCDKQKKYEELR